MICDLPVELVEEVLSYLPMTSLKAVRSTCKKLNTLSKSRSFTEKYAKKKKKKELQVIMTVQNRVSLMSVNLISPSIDLIGKVNNVDRVLISQIHHCQGLLLCITITDRLMVWNPFFGKTRWIESRYSHHNGDRYAFGYDKSLRTHKIFHFVDSREELRLKPRFEIYNLNSNSWKVLDVTPDQKISLFECGGFTVKGNTYWYASKMFKLEECALALPLPNDLHFLLCFDFTTERFGPHLPLPLHTSEYDGTLSSLGTKQLAVMFQKDPFPEGSEHILKIWISDNVEPYAVSWKELFLVIDIGNFRLPHIRSFLVVEEKNLVVAFYKHMACIIGKNGCLKRVDFDAPRYCVWQLGVCSYVLSSVQI